MLFLQDKHRSSSSLRLEQLFNKQNTPRLLTRELVAAVLRGHISPTPTLVAMHRHLLLRPLRHLSEGMQLLEKRHVIIARY